MLVYIRPQSTFPPLHSDTIFGSIVYSLNHLYPDKIDELIDLFTKKSKPPFMVSSAFPFIDTQEGQVRFYPRIIDKPVKAEMEKMKKFKKVEFIEEELFLKWVSGETDEANIINNLEKYVIEDNLLLKKEISYSFGRNPIIEPKNTINRLTGASENIFYASGDHYHNMGLFFMIKILEDEYREYLTAALRYLEDRGFGRDLSTGGGNFTLEIRKNNLKENDGDRFVTLSRYIPTSDELGFIQKDSWFDIGSKRGRSPSGEIRKQVRFFREGSTFKHFDKVFYGEIVQSGSQALEYGLAYTLSLK